MDMNQYLEIFIEESKEHLQNMNQSLLQLEQNSGDSAMLNEIFRAAHTLKGMSGTMGFSKMATLTHDMEDVLHALRSNEINVNTALIDLLFKCLDALENYVGNIINTGSEGSNDYKEIIDALGCALKNKLNDCSNDNGKKDAAKDAQGHENKAIKVESLEHIKHLQINQYDQNVINKANEADMNAFQITFYLNKGCVLKSARAFIIFQMLEKYSEIIKSEPKVEDIEDEKFDFEFTVVVITKESREYLLKELNSISEIENISIDALDSKAIESIEIIEKDENIENINTNADVSEKAEKQENSTKAASAVTKPKTGKTVRVDIDRLDVLMNLVSELIIIKTRLEGIDAGADRSNRYNEAVEYMERITTSLHDAVMKVRMVPVETVFNRFPRMIRDISKDIGKEIVLTMSGEETELDRTVIDEIGDPLIHLLRNSVDHGIEAVAKRKEAGKPEEGHIFLRAYQDGNNVIIEVEDDGQGINVDRVKKKAIEKGLLSSDIANNLSQKEIVEFLFKPSFSTADKITDLSGRGVGLDVVKTKIEALGGTVEVETEIGKGSKFIIRLPLTLAIIQALLVLVGDEKYAIPLNSIQSIENISASEIKFVQKQEVILLRNTIIPIIRLDKVFEVPSIQAEKKQLTAVIVKKGDKLSGFLVDNLIGQQEIVVKSLGKLLAGIRFIAGATILGDGNVALIIDANSLI